VLDYFDAVMAKDVETLLRLLDTYRIDATLLTPDLPRDPRCWITSRAGSGYTRIASRFIHVREPKTTESTVPELRK